MRDHLGVHRLRPVCFAHSEKPYLLSQSSLSLLLHVLGRQCRFFAIECACNVFRLFFKHSFTEGAAYIVSTNLICTRDVYFWS